MKMTSEATFQIMKKSRDIFIDKQDTIKVNLSLHCKAMILSKETKAETWRR